MRNDIRLLFKNSARNGTEYDTNTYLLPPRSCSNTNGLPRPGVSCSNRFCDVRRGSSFSSMGSAVNSGLEEEAEGAWAEADGGERDGEGREEDENAGDEADTPDAE